MGDKSRRINHAIAKRNAGRRKPSLDTPFLELDWENPKYKQNDQEMTPDAVYDSDLAPPFESRGTRAVKK